MKLRVRGNLQKISLYLTILGIIFYNFIVHDNEVLIINFYLFSITYIFLLIIRDYILCTIKLELSEIHYRSIMFFLFYRKKNFDLIKLNFLDMSIHFFYEDEVVVKLSAVDNNEIKKLHLAIKDLGIDYKVIN